MPTQYAHDNPVIFKFSYMARASQHNRFIGGEKIEWFSRDGLTVDAPYDETKDAEFYKRVCPGP